MRRPKNPKLWQREKRIIEEYLKGTSLNGISKKVGIARESVKRTLRRPHVQASLKRKQENMAERNQITEDWIMQRLVEIAGSSVGDLIEVGEDGVPNINWAAMDKDLRQSLQSFDVKHTKVGRGDNKVPVTEIKIRSADKLKAIENIMKILGIGQTSTLKVEGDEEIINRLMTARKERHANNPGEDA